MYSDSAPPPSPVKSGSGIARAVAGAALAAATARTSRAAPGSDAELTSLTLAEASARIKAGSVTSVQLTEACLARIGVYGPKLDSVITVMTEKALAQARALDAELKSGKSRGPLHGIPIMLKDNIDTAGTRTTAASAVFEDRVPAEDATVVTRLKAAGAVIIAKANLHEFAMGIGDASYWGPPRNPWALERNTGGSSSGSGASVSAELCYGALGTDTGGSIRIPSSFCGIVGLKGTYGLVPIRGIVPLTVSLDHCGPMTRTVEDAALMYDVLAGYDRLDITSVEHPKESYSAALAQPVSGIRLGIPSFFYDELDHEVDAAVKEATRVLAGLTGQGPTEALMPPFLQYGGLGGGAETYAYHREYYEKTPTRYTLPVRRRLEAMSKIEGNGAAYVRSKWSLDLLRRTVDDAFTNFDVLITPTTRVLPPLLVDLLRAQRDPVGGGAGGISEVVANTSPYDVYGLPAISVPCGFSKSGLPIGLTIAGPRFSEGKILALARAYEQATEWHKRRPALSPSMPVPSVSPA